MFPALKDVLLEGPVVDWPTTDWLVELLVNSLWDESLSVSIRELLKALDLSRADREWLQGIIRDEEENIETS